MKYLHKQKDIKVKYLTPDSKSVEFKRDWLNNEVEWISHVFCELSDQFLDINRELISIFGPKKTKMDSACILKTYTIESREGFYLYAGVQCCAGLFPEVSTEIKRMSDILDDFGYHLIYDVQNTIALTSQYSNSTYYSFKINFGKISERPNESKGVSPESDEIIKSDIEWFKQIFTRISDEIPNSIEEFEFIPFIVNNNREVLRYEMCMCVPSEDVDFINEELESIKEILESDKYKMEYKDKEMYTSTHIRRFMQMSGNGTNKLKIIQITIERNGIEDVGRTILSKIDKKFNIKESTSNNSNLLIVDVQKSFHKFFTEIYVHKLKEYATQFGNVYQIWDNHIDGKNVDKDFLYHDNPNIPVHDDLYHFPNQKDIIEKRYTYKVDANYFKKILSKEIYQKIKSSKLKKGDYFPTKEGTIITFVGNKHQWFHTPKKLYDLFKRLKGQTMTIVGGSDGECLEDIFITAEALGVVIKRDHRYIWSASHCPIK